MLAHFSDIDRVMPDNEFLRVGLRPPRALERRLFDQENRLRNRPHGFFIEFVKLSQKILYGAAGKFWVQAGNIPSRSRAPNPKFGDKNHLGIDGELHRLAYAIARGVQKAGKKGRTGGKETGVAVQQRRTATLCRVAVQLLERKQAASL